MAHLGTLDWLDIWERSLSLPEALRPCALLAPLLPGGIEDARRLPVGRRDTHLLDLYGALFGPRMPAVVVCSSCETKLEVDLMATELRLEAPVGATPLECSARGYRVVFRLPNSEDLAHLAHLSDLGEARNALLQRCVEAVDATSARVAPKELPPDLVEQVTNAMAAADPQALTELAFRCQGCEREFFEVFDIGAYLSQSLSFWAERVFDQVHMLARAYGWTEREALKLSPARRARYLSRVLS